jgi:hypothetical protein
MKFKSIKNIIPVLPELYLILAVAFYWISTSSKLNPIAIILLVVLIYQIIKRNKVLGLITATLFLVMNAYMILALFSELSEFQEFNSSAQQLAIVGFLYLCFNIIVATIMLIKYINK